METKVNPLVSVVVPSFNQGQFIGDTLQSIFNQDYPNIEVIVMDGGSTDGTLQVLRNFSHRITYSSEKDDGQSAAINKGFRLARGRIVTWLNSDDIYPDRQAISQVVDAFCMHPECNLVYGDFIEIDGTNRVLKIYKRPAFSYSRLLRIGYISQPATFFRKSVTDVMAVREDLRYVMDLEFWLRASSLDFKFQHIDCLIAAERIHADAKSVRDISKMNAEARMVRANFGAHFDALYFILRFIDRLWLYLLRIPGIFDLISYKIAPKRLTIPLSLDGAVLRTLALRMH
jgi:glycosyltransferase involved in cell wall biosynthesis